MGRSGQQIVRLTVALTLVGVVGAVLLPLRNADDSIAVGLLLAVPLAAGATIGGPAVAVLTGVGTFFYYDLVFVPPYGQLAMAQPKDVVLLGVYSVVVIGAPMMVNVRRRAREDERRRARESQHLVAVIGTLAADQPLRDLLRELVETVRATFELDGVEVLLATPTGFERAARSGSIDERDVQLVAPSGGSPRSLGAVEVDGRRILGVPVAASGQAVGLLVCSGREIPVDAMGSLRAYASQAAFAIERARLRERALESALLRQVDNWRSALLGAVSHDLRTPLASVKAAVSDLRNDAIELSDADRAELLELVESQADRLDRLVANLLDMTRIEFGELELRMEATSVDKLVAEALDAFGAEAWVDRVLVSIPKDTPPVLADHVLICQVLVNLLENAERHAPAGTTIDVIARDRGDLVEVAVEDSGPGVARKDRERVFKMFNRISGGGRAGLGLAIVDAFVVAHGGAARVEERAGGGARFVFTLPVAQR